MSGLSYVMTPVSNASYRDLRAAQAVGQVTKTLKKHCEGVHTPNMPNRLLTMWCVLRDKTLESLEVGHLGTVPPSEVSKGVGHRIGQTDTAKKVMIRRYLRQLVDAGLAEKIGGQYRATLPNLVSILRIAASAQQCSRQDEPKSVGDEEFTGRKKKRQPQPFAHAAGSAVRVRSAKQSARDANLPRSSRGRFVKIQGFLEKAAEETTENAFPVIDGDLALVVEPEAVDGMAEPWPAAEPRNPFSHQKKLQKRKQTHPTVPKTSHLGQVLTWRGNTPLTSSHPVSGAVVHLADTEAPLSLAELDALNLEFDMNLRLQDLPEGLVTYADVFCAACVSRDFPHPNIPLTTQVLAVLSPMVPKPGFHKDTNDPQGEGPTTAQHPPGQRTLARNASGPPSDASARDRSGLAP